MTSVDTQIIKKNFAWRAKYKIREGTKKYFPSHVAPHPKNRGGDPVAPVRLRNLTGAIAKEGYDRIEANTNGCAVQQKPIDEGGQAESSRTPFLLA